MARLTRQSGLATVEAAIVLPIFLMLTFALLQFGWAYMVLQDANNAVRSGARLAVRCDPTMTVQKVQDAVINQFGRTCTVSVQVEGGEPLATAHTGHAVTVTMSLNAIKSPLGSYWAPTLPQVSVTMAKEGP